MRVSLTAPQQRLATTTILLAAMRDAYRRNGEEAVANTIQAQSISPHDLETYEDRPRIRLNADDNPFYFAKIVQGGNPVETLESHARIAWAYKDFSEKLDEIVVANPGTWKTVFAGLNRFLSKQARIVVVKASSDADAFTIFETLNDRGADLTIADLLKNYLFSRSGNEIDTVQQNWIEAVAVLSEYQTENEFVTFLRHLWSSLHGATRERDLYRGIKGEVETKSDSVKFAQVLRDSAKLYGAIISPDADFWKGYGDETKAQLRTLERFNLQQNRPLLLAVLQHFTKGEIEKTIKFLVAWSVRGLVSGGIGGGQAERYICDAAVDVRSGKVKTVAELKLKLAPTIAGDTLFTQNFERFRTTSNAFARYLLLAVERQLGGKKEPELVPNTDVESVNLEHIVPQKPKAGDWPSFSAEDANVYAYRLGNMTLLQKTKNNKIGNEPWPVKKPVIATSDLLMNKAIATNLDWTKSEIENRQVQLAQLALKIWPI